jgi:hypothetical protein
MHREQPAIGLGALDAPLDHLDEQEGRRFLRLELRALAAAILDSNASGRGHIENALRFRTARQALSRGADTAEAQLEIQEGIPAYTGVRLALGVMPESLAAAARMVREVETRRSYVRSFAYGTGPALGMLLDRLTRGAWRESIRQMEPGRRDMSRMLATAAGFGAANLASSARDLDARAGQYDGATVAREETARAGDRARRSGSYRSRLITGPVLILRQEGLGRSFNPNELFPLGSDGTVYPTGVLTADWGSLTVTDGALVATDFRTVRVQAPPTGSPLAAGQTLAGPGWSLKLAPGWTVRASPGRPGDYEVVKA